MATSEGQRGRHYTAVLKIFRVEEAVPAQSLPGSINEPAKPKEPQEIASLNLRGSDLNGLVEKLGKHLDLVEED